MNSKSFWLLTALILTISCTPQPQETPAKDQKDVPFIWGNATTYFLLTDRFNNGDKTNDLTMNRKNDAAPLRGFMGGDIRGVIQKLDEGYFEKLGVNVLWMTPVFEQIKSQVDEGYGANYGFHGYWMRDWTSIDPNFGTMEDLKELVNKAHSKGIRILFDVVINHTGPVTEIDSQWPDSWVRTGPRCTYDSYESTIACTLVDNLPDIRTESNDEVDLPPFLVEKWKSEGRLEDELASLDAFFQSTGHPRAARFYIMKWLADYVRELGIDGFRVDTTKHVEESVWSELLAIVKEAFNDWKSKNPAEVLDDNEFFMLGEVYFYSIFNGRSYAFDGGEKSVDYYEYGFNSLINFSFNKDVLLEPQQLFDKYDTVLNANEFSDITTMNYISSHDDGTIPDRQRLNTTDAMTKLLLSQGIAQIYYGDETGRELNDSLAKGDATLRTFMNWEELENNPEKKKLLDHVQKIGQFRAKHPAIGVGKHTNIQPSDDKSPYVFSRTVEKSNIEDKIIIVLGESNGSLIPVGDLFSNDDVVIDDFTKENYVVEQGHIKSKSVDKIMLLSKG